MFALTVETFDELTAAYMAVEAHREGRKTSVVEPPPIPQPHAKMSKGRWAEMTIAERVAFTETEWTEQALMDLLAWAINVALVLKMLDMCAASPGQWIRFKDVCGKAEMSNDSGRGQLRALSQKVKKHLGLYSWPVVPNPVPPGRGGLAYVMDHSVAERYKVARAHL
jgi:hypothetical protein